MVFPHRSIALASAFAVTSTLLTSCGESKVTQCNRFVGLANQGADESRALYESEDKSIESNKKNLEKIAILMEKYSKQIGDLKFQDDQIKAFQKRSIDLHDRSREASRTLLAAANAKDTKAANAVVIEFRKIGEAGDKLNDDVNTYCSSANPNPPASPPAMSPSPTATSQPAK